RRAARRRRKARPPIASQRDRPGAAPVPPSPARLFGVSEPAMARSVLILTALLLPGVAHAQEQEVVVTGRGLGAAPGDAAYDISEIGRDRLEHSASNRLEDLLRESPGFQQFRRSDSRSANPTSQGATLRPLGDNAPSRAPLLPHG